MSDQPPPDQEQHDDDPRHTSRRHGRARLRPRDRRGLVRRARASCRGAGAAGCSVPSLSRCSRCCCWPGASSRACSSRRARARPPRAPPAAPPRALLRASGRSGAPRGGAGAGTGSTAGGEAGAARSPFGGGATTGQVAFVEGSTIYVTDAEGNTVKVNASKGSGGHQDRQNRRQGHPPRRNGPDHADRRPKTAA